MPLKQGYSRATVGKNIASEQAAGKPRTQAIAIALDTARRAAKAAGKPGKAPPKAPTKGKR